MTEGGTSKKVTIGIVGITAISNAPDTISKVVIGIVTVAGIAAQTILDHKKG